MAAGIKLGRPETKEQALARRTREIQEAQAAQRIREAQGSIDTDSLNEGNELTEEQLDIAAAQISGDTENEAPTPAREAVPASTVSPDANGADPDPRVRSGELPPRRPRGRPKKRPNAQQEGNDTSETSSVPAVILTGASMTSLNLPLGLAWSDWKSYAKYLRVLDKGVHWWIGDLLIYADLRGKDWDEQGVQYLTELGFSDHTLQQIKSVVLQYGPGGKKRHEALSFEHHRVVAYLPSDQAEDLLIRAEVGDGRGNAWTRDELKEEIRVRRAKGITSTPMKRGRHLHKPKQEDGADAVTGEAAPAAVTGVLAVTETPPAEMNAADPDDVRDNTEDSIDAVYDFGEHFVIRTRTLETLRACTATLQVEQNSDFEIGYESVCDTIDTLINLRNSYERLGVGLF